MRKKSKTYYAVRPDRVQVDELPDGRSIAYLRENIEEIQDQDGGTMFAADEYSTRAAMKPEKLKARIEKAFDTWLDWVKSLYEDEDEVEDPDLLEIAADHEERICMLELGV